MLRTSLSRSTWALCRWELFSHQLPLCPFLLHARLWVGFVISVGEKNCAENKNTFQGPALQASLGVSRNIERATKGDSHVQKRKKMCLEIWHALKIQHSHFFRRRSWTKRWQLRGSRWFKDSYRTSPFSGVPFYFFGRCTFLFGTPQAKNGFTRLARSTTGTHMVRLKIAKVFAGKISTPTQVLFLCTI